MDWHENSEDFWKKYLLLDKIQETLEKTKLFFWKPTCSLQFFGPSLHLFHFFSKPTTHFSQGLPAASGSSYRLSGWPTSRSAVPEATGLKLTVSNPLVFLKKTSRNTNFQMKTPRTTGPKHQQTKTTGPSSPRPGSSRDEPKPWGGGVGKGPKGLFIFLLLLRLLLRLGLLLLPVTGRI